MGMPGIQKIRTPRLTNASTHGLPGTASRCSSPLTRLRQTPSASRRHGIRITHLVAPQVWAWGKWRINKLRRRTDRLMCILPFEEQWFRDRSIPATFIGHPLFDLPTDGGALDAARGSPRPGLAQARDHARLAPQGNRTQLPGAARCLPPPLCRLSSNHRSDRRDASSGRARLRDRRQNGRLARQPLFNLWPDRCSGAAVRCGSGRERHGDAADRQATQADGDYLQIQQAALPAHRPPQWWPYALHATQPHRGRDTP